MSLAIIGLGKMGTTLLKGILSQGIYTPKDIIGCDLRVEASEANQDYEGIRTTADNRDGVQEAETILLAVKPQVIDQVLAEVEELLQDKLIISIAAGVTIEHIRELVDDSNRIVRVMPNTPALVREGVSAISPGPEAREFEVRQVKQMLAGVGEVVEVKESLMNAVTGVSGSGPAYGYIIIEALADGGVLAGLPRQQAQRLAAQTLLGAARMVLETDNHPGELKDMVTSPAGTTITGVQSLEKDGLRGILIEAVKKAADRAGELD
ncbi:MAG: pyrroline-5-carboxylate reductase [Bacillota bacterium]